MPALYRRGTFPDSPDTARRSLLLGLACSLEFERFMVLYGKYREDQARDDRGRFADEGRGEPETTGSLSRVRDDKTGDPLIDEITDRLHAVASQVHDMLGDGGGLAYGRDFHNEFARGVRGLNIPDLSAEVTYDRGVPMPYATPGAIRTDVILRSYKDGITSVTAIWDLKTGNAILSETRAAEIREKVGVGRETPLIEIQTNFGIRNKEVDHVLAVRAEPRELHLSRLARADHTRIAGRA
jgi:hypothetical protein